MPGDWTHVVVNYIGPGGSTTRGIYVYYNGELEGDHTSINPASLQAGNGRVVVGQHLPEKDQDYAGVEVDELLVFNNILDGNQIEAICLTSLTRAKCGTRSTLCWKVGNISGSTELFAL